jgi:hypothetical protein
VLVFSFLTLCLTCLFQIEDDFQWVTDHLVRIANSHSKGRVVSALEGGYQLGGEFHSAFARSVKAHVSSLAQGAQRPDEKFWQEGCDLEGRAEAEVSCIISIVLLLWCSNDLFLFSSLPTWRPSDTRSSSAARRRG